MTYVERGARAMSSLYDYAGSLERMGGDAQLFREMVGFFVTDAPGWLNQVRLGIERGDATLVHRSAHTLKGLVSNFGAQAAIKAAATVEQRAREDATLASVKPLIPGLETAIQELETALAPFHQSSSVLAR